MGSTQFPDYLRSPPSPLESKVAISSKPLKILRLAGDGLRNAETCRDGGSIRAAAQTTGVLASPLAGAGRPTRGAQNVGFCLHVQAAHPAMLGHLVMHREDRVVFLAVMCEAISVGIAHVAICCDQLTTGPIQLRTTKRIHGDTSPATLKIRSYPAPVHRVRLGIRDLING
jgi:hypothetical protein